MHPFFKLVCDALKGKPIKRRSSEWGRVEREHLEKEPCCQWCGSQRKLQVHHIEPFHIHPEKELDPTNLITLCEGGGKLNCHLIHGHNGNWRHFNPRVREDCKEYGWPTVVWRRGAV